MTQKTTIRIPDELMEKIDEYAEKNGYSTRTEIFIMATKKFLDEQEVEQVSENELRMNTIVEGFQKQMEGYLERNDKEIEVLREQLLIKDQQIQFKDQQIKLKDQQILSLIEIQKEKLDGGLKLLTEKKDNPKWYQFWK